MSRKLRLSIAAFAPNDWMGQWVNRQYLLSRLGASHDVVYSTGAWFIWDRKTPEWKSASLTGTWKQVNGVVLDGPPKWNVRWPKYRAVDRIALRVHANRIERKLKSLGDHPQVVLLFHPMFVPYLDFFHSEAIAYHAYDLFEGTPGWSPELDGMEVELLRRAKFVTTVTETIAARLRQKGAADVRILPNGVDLEIFNAKGVSSLGVPSDLQQIPRPRMGYVGSLHPQVDFGLLANLARRHSSWHFVLIGGSPTLRDARAALEIDECRLCANVHFLGQKARHEVPRYLAGMDVNLMVYRITPDTWIRAGYPLKLHEYFACGKPIVSADLEAVRPYDDVVRIAATLEEWESALQAALESDKLDAVEKRQKIARANGWQERANLLESWLLDSCTAPTSNFDPNPQSRQGT